jgi:Spy/CpxP family protein refolding chaperone
MKRILLFTGMLILFAGLQAQGRPNNHQQMLNQIRQKKVAFIQQRLNLTPEQAKQFWPVYYEYEQKRWDLMKASRENFRRNKGENGKTANYEQMTDNMINFDLMRAQLAKNYYELFKRILPPQTLFQYYVADKDFKEWLLQDIKRKAEEHPQR